MDPDLRQTILDHETAFWTAIRDKDGDAAARLCGETTIAINSMGAMVVSAEKMGQMTTDSKWTLHDFSFGEVQVIAPGPDVAIICYVARQDYTMDGVRTASSAAQCSTWIRGQNGWLCHAHAESELKKMP